MYVITEAARGWCGADRGGGARRARATTCGPMRHAKRRRVMGRGQYGCVVDASDAGAVKIVEVDKTDNLQGLFFDREVESLRRVDHDNVVKMLGWGKSDYMDMGRDEGISKVYGFIRMERGGCDVHKWIHDKPLQATLSTRTKLRMIKGLISGMVAIHNAGIVHRDIKPRNIVVCDGRMKFCDFGLAQLDGSPSREARRRAVRELGAYAVVTYPYRAPELEVFQDSGAAMDIWSLACTVYEILTKTLLMRVTAPNYVDHTLEAVGAENYALRSDVEYGRKTLVDAARETGRVQGGLLYAMVERGIFEHRASTIRYIANAAEGAPHGELARCYEAATTWARCAIKAETRGTDTRVAVRIATARERLPVKHPEYAKVMHVLCDCLEPFPHERLSASTLYEKFRVALE